MIQERTMTDILDIMTILCIGLLIGTEFAVSAFINPVLRKLEDRAQARAISLFAGRLGKAMPFWYCFSLLLLIIESAVRHHEPSDLLLIAASGIWFVVIVLTLLFLVPINNRMMKLDARSFPTEAQQEDRRWETLHRGRVVALAASLVCVLIAVRS
jgi:uncharacterized membrane protein